MATTFKFQVGYSLVVLFVALYFSQNIVGYAALYVSLDILVGNIPASLVRVSTWFLYMVGAGTCWTPVWKGAVKGSMKDDGGWLIPWQVAKACALETTSFESRGRAWTGTWECTWWSRWWGHVRAFVEGLHCCSQNGWFDSYHKQSSRCQISSRWARISPNFKTAPVDDCSDGASWGLKKRPKDWNLMEFALKVIQLQIINIGRLWNLSRSICPDPWFNMSFCSCAYLGLFYYSPSKLTSWVQDPRVKDSSPDRLQLNFELTKKTSPFAAIQGLGARHGVFFLIFGHFQRWISVEDGGFLTGFFAVAFHGEILDKVWLAFLAHNLLEVSGIWHDDHKLWQIICSTENSIDPFQLVIR